jgi:hypothetical protein
MSPQIFIGTSEGLTDWEEDSESCDEDICIQSGNLHQISDRFVVCCEEGNTLIKPTLEQGKQALIERLTRQFWTNFHRYQNQEYGLDINSGMSSVNTVDEVRFGSSSLKRGHEEDDVGPCTFHNNDSSGPKRFRVTPSVSEVSEKLSKFACPYRKHDPKKYSVPNWGPCALTPLQTVARVK